MTIICLELNKLLLRNATIVRTIYNIFGVSKQMYYRVNTSKNEI